MIVVAVINFPAVLLELPVELTAGQRIAHTLSFRAWRAVTCPLLGMIFWWIAGRGTDALKSARSHRVSPRMTWLEAVWGFLLVSAGSTSVIGVEFFSGSDRQSLQSFAAVAALWAFLGSLSVAAKIVQWRLRRRQIELAST
jgi:hypothetical protein